MLSCYIIDDELHAIKSLQLYIEKTPHLQLLGYNENPLAALSHFQDTRQYADITFLDIDMPQISGIELSALLQGKTAIVFTTAHPDFALDAFEMNINDYLLKPFSYQRFIKCITRLNDYLVQNSTKKKESPEDFFYIQAEGKGKMIKLLFRDLLYIESLKNYISITTSKKKHITYLTLHEVMEKLPPNFFRISKSFIINSEKISHIEGNEIFLSDVQQGFYIGTSFKESFSAHVKEYLIKTKRG